MRMRGLKGMGIFFFRKYIKLQLMRTHGLQQE